MPRHIVILVPVLLSVFATLACGCGVGARDERGAEADSSVKAPLVRWDYSPAEVRAMLGDPDEGEVTRIWFNIEDGPESQDWALACTQEVVTFRYRKLGLAFGFSFLGRLVRMARDGAADTPNAGWRPFDFDW